MNPILINKKWEDTIDSVPEAKYIITSPPYNIGKKYNTYKDNLSEEEYIEWMKRLFCALSRNTTSDGHVFFNLGFKPTRPDLPSKVLTAVLKDYGEFHNFQLQNNIIWVKSVSVNFDYSIGHYQPNRSEKYFHSSWEHVWHFTKTPQSIDKLSLGVGFMDPKNKHRWGDKTSRCRGGVWIVPYETRRAKNRHPAHFPKQLVRNCLSLGGAKPGDTVYDPFGGSFTTAEVCKEERIQCYSSEPDKKYFNMGVETIYGKLTEDGEHELEQA